MDNTLGKFERFRIKERAHHSSMPVSNETSVHAAFRNDKRGTETAAIGPLIPSDHLPFHGNPLDRSGTEEWERDHLPGALKGKNSSQFLPVNGRSVFGMKHMDSSSHIETFTLFWLSSADFRQQKNGLFPDATTHLLGKADEAGWRFVVSLSSDTQTALRQLRKLQPKLCAADVRELCFIAGQEDLAIAGQAVAIAQWHQVNQFCPQCGSPSVSAVLGTARQCTMSKGHATLRPSVAPVAVALVQSPDGQRVLLVRTQSMRPHMVNCVSTRIDVCEGVAEKCIDSRHRPLATPPDLEWIWHGHLRSGIRSLWSLLRLKVSDVHVHGSQPWAAGLTTGSELLLGAVATAEDTEVSHNSSEVEEAHWFSRQALQALLKGSAVPEHPIKTGFLDPEAKFFLPPPVTMSHALLKYWVELP